MLLLVLIQQTNLFATQTTGIQQKCVTESIANAIEDVWCDRGVFSQQQSMPQHGNQAAAASKDNECQLPISVYLLVHKYDFVYKLILAKFYVC